MTPKEIKAMEVLAAFVDSTKGEWEAVVSMRIDRRKVTLSKDHSPEQYFAFGDTIYEAALRALSMALRPHGAHPRGADGGSGR